MCHIPCAALKMQRENNLTFNFAICNDIFTTLFFFYTFKIKAFPKLNLSHVIFVLQLVTQNINIKET